MTPAEISSCGVSVSHRKRDVVRRFLHSSGPSATPDVVRRSVATADDPAVIALEPRLRDCAQSFHSGNYLRALASAAEVVRTPPHARPEPEPTLAGVSGAEHASLARMTLAELESHFLATDEATRNALAYRDRADVRLICGSACDVLAAAARTTYVRATGGAPEIGTLETAAREIARGVRPELAQTAQVHQRDLEARYAAFMEARTALLARHRGSVEAGPRPNGFLPSPEAARSHEDAATAVLPPHHFGPGKIGAERIAHVPSSVTDIAYRILTAGRNYNLPD